MNTLSRSPQNATRNVMETIMKPLNWTKRPGRWLMAAAMTIGLNMAPASAQEPLTSLPEVLKLEKKPGGPTVDEPKIFFSKVGGQIGKAHDRLSSACNSPGKA